MLWAFILVVIRDIPCLVVIRHLINTLFLHNLWRFFLIWPWVQEFVLKLKVYLSVLIYIIGILCRIILWGFLGMVKEWKNLKFEVWGIKFLPQKIDQKLVNLIHFDQIQLNQKVQR
jgi:hypothetical protein